MPVAERGSPVVDFVTAMIGLNVVDAHSLPGENALVYTYKDDSLKIN
jgi:hypothetical protein